MGNQLSGGEQQMLAIGRALMTNPKLLILDEATEGLAPLVRGEIWACLSRLKADGQSILLVDKHLEPMLKLAERHVIVERGHVVWTGTSDQLANDANIRQQYLMVLAFHLFFRPHPEEHSEAVRLEGWAASCFETAGFAASSA